MENNVTIPLNVLYAKKEKHVILLMIANGKGHQAKSKGCKIRSKAQPQWR